ncbi:putative lipoprotein (plasmid) [Nostoc sp. NIES-3756]|uniref:Vgb family protein n=1 Tax=Nostoc sp. NIES-3756 TaxID=1751286 RepID=UPI0007208E43|nr:NHL repeat-containing protein [Nostoc sp. NIES-3756]BAT56916.1 putative lipoprotein [Nostoc sp. NIES-3756]
MMRHISQLIPLGTVVAVLNLTAPQAYAFLLVSSVANEPLDPNNPAVINLDLTDNFTVGNSSILKYDEKTGKFLGVFVSKGVIGLSSGITFGKDGYLYAADQANNSILRFDGKKGTLIDTFLQFGTSGPKRPEDIAFGPDGNLYISGLAGGGVQKYDFVTGLLSVVTQTNSQGGNLLAAGLSFGPDGNLYISSVLNDNSILRYNPITGLQDTFIASNIAQPVPSGTVFSPDGKSIYNGTFIGAPTIKQYDGTTGALVGDFVTENNNGGLQTSSRLRFGKDGNLYVSDFLGNAIRRYDGQTGSFIDSFVPAGSGGLKNPGGFAFSTTVPEPYSLVGILAVAAYLGTSQVLKQKRKYQQISGSKLLSQTQVRYTTIPPENWQ